MQTAVTIDSFLTIIAIIIALFALARPVRQKAIMIFTPSFMVVSFLILSLANFLILDFFNAFQIEISSKKSFFCGLFH